MQFLLGDIHSIICYGIDLDTLMCHYVPEMEFHIIQYPLTLKLHIPELEPTSINTKYFLKYISIYRDRSGPVLSQYVGLSVFKVNLKVYITKLYNKFIG